MPIFNCGCVVNEFDHVPCDVHSGKTHVARGDLDRVGGVVATPRGRALQLPSTDPCEDGGVIVFARIFADDPYLQPYVYAAVRVNGLYFLSQRGVGGPTAVPARRWEKLVEWLGDECLGMVRMRPAEIIVNVLVSGDVT